jgi:uncharacterized protein
MSTQYEAPDFECLDIEQVSPDEQEKALTEGNRPLALLVYLLLGTYLGFVFVQAEVVSWFRIQEMFRFQSFHMYGIIGSAIAVAAASLFLIRKANARTLHGEHIQLSEKDWGEGRVPGARYWLGGSFFGVGWALLGACPGPIFALIGVGIIAPATGLTVMVVALGSAMAGTWTYAALRHRLPH